MPRLSFIFFFFFNDPAPPEIYTLSLHDALPICPRHRRPQRAHPRRGRRRPDLAIDRSEEHTSELQSPDHLVCRLLLEKKKPFINIATSSSIRSARVPGSWCQVVCPAQQPAPSTD